jgi:protein-tyrosine sulfotransferase
MTGRDPIFILGIMQRSGTNWLRDLLLCHQDCYAARIQEDFLVANSHLLLRFGSSLYGTWPQNWKAETRVGPQERLHRILGEALLAFIGDGMAPSGSGDGVPSSARLVTKTPSVTNVEHLLTFFPNARVILLVRDGRAVVESIVQGFNWDYETGIRRWDSAAREILKFRAAGGPALERSAVVRYEDLYTATESELRRLLTFLDLDPARFDFQRALSLPVRGSSVFGQERGGSDSNQPEEAEEFSPLARAAHWSRWRHERFNRIAGESLESFGYERIVPGKSSPLAPAVHWLRDLWWSVPRRLLAIGFLLSRAFGRSDPDFRDATSVYYMRGRHAKPKPPTAHARPAPKSGREAPRRAAQPSAAPER